MSEKAKYGELYGLWTVVFAILGSIMLAGVLVSRVIEPTHSGWGVIYLNLAVFDLYLVWKTNRKD